MAAADKQFAVALPFAGLPTDIWAATPEIDGCRPDAEMQSWLTETGLLTRRLRRLCGDRFNMRVLRDQPCSVSAGLHREVLLCCGERSCIYAITDVPAATLAAHPWLAKLGDEPLGESLQARAGGTPSVSRSNFSYALLDSRHLPAATRGPVWARRSEFRIGTDALGVTEVFLTNLAGCESNAEHESHRPE